ncbi:MAG: rane or secreted protein [Segetibacter sp.]|jgi:hypothetical protein|nr:rane or secreted protein [Segetibacter sp.]
MKTVSKFFTLFLLLFACAISTGFYTRNAYQTNGLNGAWMLENNKDEQVLLFADNYFSQTGYNQKEKKFQFTRGGTFDLQNGQMNTKIEFDTRRNDEIGKPITYRFSLNNDKLTLDINGEKQTWKQIDKGADNLAGTWKITARKQDDKIVPIHQTGPRKTLKILTGTRFQWAAINPETKEFFGTGGGSYSFKNGKYTENIEFFSRDSSRVGAALTFDGKLENGAWHHSGLSSRGDSIYEVWGRIK